MLFILDAVATPALRMFNPLMLDAGVLHLGFFIFGLKPSIQNVKHYRDGIPAYN